MTEASDILPSGPMERGSSRGSFWPAVLLVIAIFGVFHSVLSHHFLFWDDDVFILRNPELNPPNLAHLAKFWGNPLHGYNQFLVPLNYTVWWVLAHVACVPDQTGGSPYFMPPAFHALNLVFHTTAALLVFWILRRLVRHDGAALIGAMFFALHPMQAEPVSWAANMYTSLSGCLSLAAMLIWLVDSDRRVERRDWRGRAMFCCATLCFTLALLSKPSVVLLPLMVAAIEIMLRGRSVRQCAPPLVWLGIGAIDALITHHVQTGVKAFHPPLWQRPFVAADALLFYLRTTIAPVRLVPDYGRSPQWVLAQKFVWFEWIIPAALVWLCLLLRRRVAWLSCGVVLFILGVLPMLGLLPFDFQGFSTVGDRYAYLSLFGAALIAAFLIERSVARLTLPRIRRIAVGIPVTAICLFAELCHAQVDRWTDTKSLFEYTLTVNPVSAVAHMQLGYLLMSQPGAAAAQGALDHYMAVLDGRPNDPFVLCNAGTALRRLNHPGEAALYFQEAWDREHDPEFEYRLGESLAAAGDRRDAIAALRDLTRQHPDYQDAEFRLGQLLEGGGARAEAADHYRTFLRANPRSIAARLALRRLTDSVGQASIDPR